MGLSSLRISRSGVFFSSVRWTRYSSASKAKLDNKDMCRDRLHVLKRNGDTSSTVFGIFTPWKTQNTRNFHYFLLYERKLQSVDANGATAYKNTLSCGAPQERQHQQQRASERERRSRWPASCCTCAPAPTPGLCW